jgi:hypothetical protein
MTTLIDTLATIPHPSDPSFDCVYFVLSGSSDQFRRTFRPFSEAYVTTSVFLRDIATFVFYNVFYSIIFVKRERPRGPATSLTAPAAKPTENHIH